MQPLTLWLHSQTSQVTPMFSIFITSLSTVWPAGRVFILENSASLFRFVLLIQVLRGILHGTGPPAALFFSTVRPHCSAAHRTAQKCKAYRNTNCCSHCHIHRLLKPKRQERRPFRLLSPAAVLMHSVQRLLLLRES